MNSSSPHPAVPKPTGPGSLSTGRRPGPWLVWSLVALLSASFIGFSFSWDESVRQKLLAYQDKVAAASGTKWQRTKERRVWAMISRYGDWPQLMLAGGAFLGLALWRKRADWTRVIVAALLASTLAGLLANSVRLTSGRVRPRGEATHGQGFLGPRHEGRWTVGVPDLNSFPSGHTATAVGFAGPFLLAKPLVGVPLCLGAAAIALSRILLGAHHFSDVVSATVLALIVSWWMLWWVKTQGTATATALREKVQAYVHGQKRRDPPN